MLSVDAAHVVVEAVKRSDEDAGALVVRLYEAWGRRGPVTVRAPWNVRRATLTDLLERELADVESVGAEITLDMTPFQITTLKLERSED
jgi:alpha-mannosidase